MTRMLSPARDTSHFHQALSAELAMWLAPTAVSGKDSSLCMQDQSEVLTPTKGLSSRAGL